MSNLPIVQDDFGAYDVTDLLISLKDAHPKGFGNDDPAVRLIGAFVAEIERLQRRCEIYASGMFAIAVPLDGLVAEDLTRIAQDTLARLQRFDEES